MLLSAEPPMVAAFVGGTSILTFEDRPFCNLGPDPFRAFVISTIILNCTWKQTADRTAKWVILPAAVQIELKAISSKALFAIYLRWSEYEKKIIQICWYVVTIQKKLLDRTFSWGEDSKCNSKRLDAGLPMMVATAVDIPLVSFQNSNLFEHLHCLHLKSVWERHIRL